MAYSDDKDIIRWITWNGRRIPIKKGMKGKFDKQLMKEEKERKNKKKKQEDEDIPKNYSERKQAEKLKDFREMNDQELRDMAKGYAVYKDTNSESKGAVREDKRLAKEELQRRKEQANKPEYGHAYDVGYYDKEDYHKKAYGWHETKDGLIIGSGNKEGLEKNAEDKVIYNMSAEREKNLTPKEKVALRNITNNNKEIEKLTQDNTDIYNTKTSRKEWFNEHRGEATNHVHETKGIEDYHKELSDKDKARIKANEDKIEALKKDSIEQAKVLKANEGKYPIKREKIEKLSDKEKYNLYKEAKYNNILEKLNDEGSDFTFGEAKIENGKLKTDVGVFMPDERGYTTKELEIPLSEGETGSSLEEKLRDWQSRHDSPDSFYDKDFEETKYAKDGSRIQKMNKYDKWQEGKRYRDKLKKISSPDIPDGTYDVNEGTAVDFKGKGYNVSFEQSGVKLDDGEYYDAIDYCRNKCDGNVYAGKFGGDPEISFYTKDKKTAMEIAKKYNQHSIWDVENERVILNPDYNESTNKVNYKEKSGNDYLPKATTIKVAGNSNRKEVKDTIQAHILDHYDNPVDFMEQMDVFDNMPTKWHAGQEMAREGFYDIYYDDQREFLESLNINPKGKKFNDDRVFQTYTSLIGRESENLYNKLQKLYDKYKAEHKNSNVTLDDFRKWFK